MLRPFVIGPAILVLILAACVAPTPMPQTAGTGPVTGSGNLVTQAYDFEDFTAVNIGSAGNLTVTPGESFSVSITIDDNLADYLVVDKEVKSLRISLQPDRQYRNVTFEATVVMPTLQSIGVEGASQAVISGFQDLERPIFVVDGASNLQGDVQATDLNITAEGASQVRLSGSADTVSVKAGGASKVDLAELPAGYGSVEATGTSKVTVHVNGTLDAQSVGASTVTYVGDTTPGMIVEGEAGTVRPK